MTPVEWIQESVKICIQNISNDGTAGLLEELESVYKAFLPKEREVVHDILCENFEVNDSLYILSNLVTYTKNNDFYLDIAKNILKGKFDCFTRAMLEIQLQVKGKILPYEVMRSIHKKSVECFEKEIECELPWIFVEKRKANHIAIVTEQLLSLFHAPTRMVLELSYIMKKHLGYEIEVFTCTSNRRLSQTLWIETKGYNGLEEEQFIIDYKGFNFTINNYPMRNADKELYRKMLLQIYEWNPIFVLNMGVANPIVDLVRNFTTVAAMEMTVNCPMSEAQIILRHAKDCDELEKEYSRMMNPDQIQLFIEKKMPPIIEKTSGHYSRGQFGIPEDKFAIAIVGNRLDRELDACFADIMKRILRQNSNVVFVIIGQVEIIQCYFMEDDIQNRIYYLGYCEDLFGLYKILDLYLNPNRIGGGYSGAMALEAGLPIVTLSDCDVAYYVNKEFCVKGLEEMVQEVCRYASDSVFYTEKKEKIKAVIGENTDQNMIDYVKWLTEKIKKNLNP